MGRSDRVIAFIENLKITSGIDAGKPFILRSWQKDILRQIYRENETGERIAREVLFTVARKNGKSALASALILVHLIGPEAEQRGQVFSCAADKKQASIVFNEAVAFIQADPELSQMVKILESIKRIVCFSNGSYFQALSADAKLAHGLSASFCIYDELAQCKDGKLYETIKSSTGARKQPLIVTISTQSSDPNHIMTKLVDYGQKILDGVLDDPRFVPIIFTTPQDADIHDPASWAMSNPALGDFLTIESMQIESERARNMPSAETAFRALRLNQRVDSIAGFISQNDWKANGESIRLEALEGQSCICGLDLSSTKDLTALVAYFPESGAVLTWFFLPGEGIAEKENQDRVPYQLWAKQGHIELTPGRAINRKNIAIRVIDLLKKFDVQAIAYDRWKIEELQNVLDDLGVDAPLVPFGQGFKDMGPAVDALEAAILNRQLKHANNPVLTFNAASAKLEIDAAGARKLSKQKSTNRIDGLVALAMALRQAGKIKPKIAEPQILFV